MARTLNNAYASSPTAAVDTLIYTCPADTSAVVSNINIVNKSATPTEFRVYFKLGGGTDTVYLYYDIIIGGNDTFNRVAGDVLKEGDKIYVRNTLATLDFFVSLQENS